VFFCNCCLDHLPRNGDVIVLEEMCEAENVAWLAASVLIFSEFLVPSSDHRERNTRSSQLRETVIAAMNLQDAFSRPALNGVSKGLLWCWSLRRCVARRRETPRGRLRRDGMLDRWFFSATRPVAAYRLRFCSEARILDQLALRRVFGSATEILRVTLSIPYHREIERYGGVLRLRN